MALCYFELKIDLPIARNLKAKRGVLKSLTSKITKKYNVSISEIDFHDVWKSSKIGIAIVAKNGNVFDSMIENIIEYIEFSFPDIRVSIIYRENH